MIGKICSANKQNKIDVNKMSMAGTKRMLFLKIVFTYNSRKYELYHTTNWSSALMTYPNTWSRFIRLTCCLAPSNKNVIAYLFIEPIRWKRCSAWISSLPFASVQNACLIYKHHFIYRNSTQTWFWVFLAMTSNLFGWCRHILFLISM